MDFWGETIFIPSYSPSSEPKQNKNNILSSFTNCYKASKTTEVYFSIESALSEQSGEMFKFEPEAGTSTTDSGHEE